ncbi:MAG: transcriptional regulator [Planctomycetes bacterium RBG_16_59_8]|nr:MAG: transcriptional regulator [Planctomycetes bacterium RBG_16_59_8]
MSGHSHWATIKHKKGATDAKKGKMFSKCARYVMVAAKSGGGDPTMNIKLQYAIDKAKAVNMPKENIDRAIKKGIGELDGVIFEETVYEAYGAGGAAIMVEALTDNKNRTGSEVRKILESRGGSMGSANCVSWLFERKGLILIPNENVSEDDLMTVALDAGADNVELSGEDYEVTSPIPAFAALKETLSKKYRIKSGELTLIPKNLVAVGQEDGKKLLALMEELDEHDDVQNVYSNFDLPETFDTK